MSKIGRKPIEIPNGVECEIINNTVKTKGPKGELVLEFDSTKTKVTKDNNQIIVERTNNSKPARSLHGLIRQLIENNLIGVEKGFEKKLEVKGVGYRVSLAGNKLNLSLGYSHPIEFPAPEGITFKVEKTIITISGINKQQVGQIAAQIRALRAPEPYKGKGIRYIDEVIKKKAGKSAKAGAAGTGA